MRTAIKTLIPVLGLSLAVVGCGQGESSDHKSAQTDQKATQSQTEKQDSQSSASASGFDSKLAKRSYALGINVGKSIKAMSVDVSMKQLTAGMTDVLKGNDLRLSKKEMRKTLMALAGEVRKAKQDKRKQKASENTKAGKEFRQQYKKQDGVTVTDSGLMYKVLEQGDGATPDKNDRVKVHYEGRLVDGTVFDSSYKRDEPVVFPVSAVIPGWTEALQLMNEGARYEVVIPPELAYGKRGAGKKIGPNETLIFEVELIKVMPEDSQSSGDKSSK